MKKHKSIRWTKVQAESEFKVSEEKLTKRLKAAGIIPGKDGCFSTVQIVQAIYNDSDIYKAKLIKEQYEGQVLKNDEARGKVIEVEELKERMEVPIIAVRQLILSETQLTPEAKEEILLNLQNLFAAIFGGRLTRPESAKAFAAAKKLLAVTKKEDETED